MRRGGLRRVIGGDYTLPRSRDLGGFGFTQLPSWRGDGLRGRLGDNFCGRLRHRVLQVGAKEESDLFD